MNALGGEWEALFAACDRPSSCASHAWICAWWQAFGENPHGAGQETRPFVVVVRTTEGTLIGVAPFFEEQPAGWTRVRRLRAMGYLGREGVFDMTEEPSLLILSGWEDRVLALLAEALRPGLASGRWDAILLRLHAEDTQRPFQKAFGIFRSRAFAWNDVRAGSDYAELPATWAEYRKQMTRSMRDNLPYYPRLLTRDGHDWTIRILRDPEEILSATTRLTALHRARAGSERGLRHNDHIPGPAQATFLACLLERLADEGRAFVAELIVAGDVVASQAFIEEGETLMVYYSGYDERWYRYSPVFIIDAFVFREALERGVRRLDFLRNPAPWKARWLAQPGPAMHRATLVSLRPESLARYALHLVVRGYRRNVTERAPILGQRFLKFRTRLESEVARLTVSALPAVSRVGFGAHLHHRLLLHHLR